MKTAVITGASYGIGQAIAENLLKEGWKVYGVSRSKPEFHDPNFVWITCDLSKPNQIEKKLKLIKEPALDAFISNAGVVTDELATDVTLESYDFTFSVNVLAPMLLVHGLRKKISKATIISVSSVSDRIPDPLLALYCSSKGANTLYFDCLAAELKQARVYTLLPDYVDTPMLRTEIEDPNFDWDGIIKVPDLARLVSELVAGKTKVESGANIIVVTESLKGSFKSREKLYGYNTNTQKITKLN